MVVGSSHEGEPKPTTAVPTAWCSAVVAAVGATKVGLEDHSDAPTPAKSDAV